MKKLLAIFAVVMAFATTALAQSVSCNHNNDTLFLIINSDDSIYITKNDVIDFEHQIAQNTNEITHDAYYLTDAKFKQLDSIHVDMSHYIGLQEKTTNGVWQAVHVQYPWDSYFPGDLVPRMLYIGVDDGKIVHQFEGRGCLNLIRFR